jgi:hypothetical protein
VFGIVLFILQLALIIYSINLEYIAYNKRDIIVMETFLLGAELIIFGLSLKYNKMLDFVGFAIVVNSLGLAAAYELSN